VQWITSLVVADDILPKPPWLAFDPGTLFKVDCSCSNTRASLQYALQVSFDGGHIQSYLSGVTCKCLWLVVFFQYISNCRWPSTARTDELLMIEFTWEEDPVCWKPPWPLQSRQVVVNTDAVEAEVYAVYLEERECMLKQVGNIPGRVNLTVQSWATSQTLGYISLAGQFIDSKWKLHQRMLNLVMVSWTCSENAITEAISRSLPWPAPLSTWIWFQLSANRVLSCPVSKLQLTIFHCVSCWDSVHCSTSRGKEFKFKMLNEDESYDAVLLVFASKPSLPNAMNATEISDQLGLHSLCQHHFTTTVEAQSASTVWLLLTINSLAHEKFQFSSEIKKMMGTTVIVLLDIFTREASGNHLISFPEILIWAWECWISIFLAQVDLFRLVPWDPGGLQLLVSVSMAGCALTQQRVQRKCGGNCRCFLLDVTGQNFRVATPCIKCKVFCREFILLDLCFLTTSKARPYLLIETQKLHGVVYGVMPLPWSCYELTQDPLGLFVTSLLCQSTSVLQSSAQEGNAVLSHAKFPWDPGGSILLYRLGGKPSVKEREMLGTMDGPVTWTMGLEPSPDIGWEIYMPRASSEKDIEQLYKPTGYFLLCNSSSPTIHLLPLESLASTADSLILYPSLSIQIPGC
jgi:hypothetical protein